MELSAKLKDISQKIETSREQITTEEATKTAFVLPFIAALGYDVFNPGEVVPEFTADIGLKKGEKVDYCILHGDSPAMIFECKNWTESLDAHTSQLYRYFGVTDARFGILTNGIQYQFFTDLQKQNKMDYKPFFSVDLQKLRNSHITELIKFQKENFDVDKICSDASNLKYASEIKKYLLEQLEGGVDEALVRFLVGKFYSGKRTAKVVSQFSDVFKKSFQQFLSEKVNDRLQAAINKEKDSQEETSDEPDPTMDIVTTEEELNGFLIVRAILSKVLPVSRIVHRDVRSYFGILLDNNNRKPICRLYLDGNKKFIGVFDNKHETRHEIDSIDSIYQFSDDLLRTVSQYDG